MFLMFALRRPDVLPVGDLGIRMAMQKAWNLSELPKPDEMETDRGPVAPLGFRRQLVFVAQFG